MAAYRVLVVEDNHEVRRMVSASIKALDPEIEVLDVPSAEEALLISTSLPLDLVILDIRLPGMSGLEMVTRLLKRRPDTKVIIVTGVEDAFTRQQVSQADVAAYFFKPIEINAFLEAVKRSLWPEPAVAVPVSAESVENAPSEVPVEAAIISQPEAGTSPEHKKRSQRIPAHA
jgi:CheY-like chemotaxis protein